MDFALMWIATVALLANVAAGLETKMFQLTMPNVRPYRVIIEL